MCNVRGQFCLELVTVSVGIVQKLLYVKRKNEISAALLVLMEVLGFLPKSDLLDTNCSEAQRQLQSFSLSSTPKAKLHYGNTHSRLDKTSEKCF